MTLGENIKSIRKRKGIKQSELASKLGFTVRTIQNYESGNREPNMQTLMKICTALECAPMEIIGLMDFEKLETQAKEKAQLIRKKLAPSDEFCLYDIEVIISSAILKILGEASHSSALNYSLNDFNIEEEDELINFVFNSYQLKVNEILERHKKSSSKKESIVTAAHNDFSDDSESQRLIKELLEKL